MGRTLTIPAYRAQFSADGRDKMPGRQPIFTFDLRPEGEKLENFGDLIEVASGRRLLRQIRVTSGFMSHVGPTSTRTFAKRVVVAALIAALPAASAPVFAAPGNQDPNAP